MYCELPETFDKIRGEHSLLCPTCFQDLADEHLMRLCWVPYEREVADEAVEFDTAAAFAAWRRSSKIPTEPLPPPTAPPQPGVPTMNLLER